MFQWFRRGNVSFKILNYFCAFKLLLQKHLKRIASKHVNVGDAKKNVSLESEEFERINSNALYIYIYKCWARNELGDKNLKFIALYTKRFIHKCLPRNSLVILILIFSHLILFH